MDEWKTADVYFDFSEAFNTVFYNILTEKMKSRLDKLMARWTEPARFNGLLSAA